METRLLDVDGLRIGVRLAGSGKPLVLIHGLGGPMALDSLIPYLARYCAVAAIDLPGFGNSPATGDVLSATQHAEIVRAAAGRLLTGRFALAGLSYGGQISVVLAARYPDAVDRVILINSSGLQPRIPLLRNDIVWGMVRLGGKYLLLNNERLCCALGRRSFYQPEQRPPDLCRRFHEMIMKPGSRDAWMQCIRNIFSQDEIQGYCSGVMCPVLIIGGEKDRIVRVRYQHAYHERLRSSSLEIIHDGGHTLTLELPEGIAQRIGTFCSGS